MNTNSTFSELTEPALFRVSHPSPFLEQRPSRRAFKPRKLFPKRYSSRARRRILLIAALAALAAQSPYNPLTAATVTVPSSLAIGADVHQTYPGMPWLDYSRLPWLDYSKIPSLDYSKLPWLTPPPRPQAAPGTSAQALIANLQADIQSAVSALASLTDSFNNEQQSVLLAGETASLATDLSTLSSRDLSALCSQDLSVNCGQLLSTCLAVPTSPPRPNWNRQAPVISRTSAADVAAPTYPPRTPWGNGGIVVTTPGGAVLTVMPSAPETRTADVEKLRALARQLQAMQDNMQRLDLLLKNNLPNTVFPAVSMTPHPTDNHERN